jgi:uncharacterized protein YggT (Ycf19 family)
LSLFIIQLINTAFTVLIWLIIGRCILSFVSHNPYHPIIKFVYDITEPIMSPFRRLLPGTASVSAHRVPNSIALRTIAASPPDKC